MRDLVDRQEGVLIECPADCVGGGQKEWGERLGMSEEDGEGELGEEDEEDEGEGHGCRTHQSADLLISAAGGVQKP